MNAEMLRASIIQKAIEGKLVPQLDEEPKVEQGGALPEETSFEIPEKWKWVRLSDVADFVAGQSPEGSSITSNEVGFEFHQGKSFFSERFLEKSDKFTLDAKKVASSDSLLLSLRAPVGDINITPREVAIGRGLCAIKPKNLLDLTYCFYVLSRYKRYFQERSTGSTFKAITMSTVKNVFIPLAPVEEQKRIVKKIEELLPLIEEYGRDQERLEKINKDFPVQMEKSLLQEAISGKLVPQRDDEPEVEQFGEFPEEAPFEIPEKWKWVTLSDVVLQISDGTHNPPKNNGSGVPVLSAKNIINNNVDFSSVNRWVTHSQWALEDKKIHIEVGDVLLTIVGTIGRTAVVKTEEKFILQRSVCILKPKHNLVDSAFLAIVFYAPSIVHWMTARAAGTAQKGIYLKTLKTLPFALPPLEEQRRIVAKLKKLMTEIQKLN